MDKSITERVPDLMIELSSFKRDICRILYHKEDDEILKGLDVKSRLEEIYGEEVNHGRLYPNLDQLAEDGLVNKQKLNKRSNYYELTDDGKEAFEGYVVWLSP